jgi:hypothetical protein
MKTTKFEPQLADVIARWSNGEYSTSIDYLAETLWRTTDDRYYLKHTTGAAMLCDRDRYLAADEARDFVANRAFDPVSGYTYGASQAAEMVA